MTYLLVIRDSDGAILGSQRGVDTFSGQRSDHEMGPFGDMPFQDATTLKPGYSSHLVTVEPRDKQPRSPDSYWDGAAVVPSSETFQDAWLDAAAPQRSLARRRAAAISNLRAHPDDPVDAESMLRLLGETERGQA